MTVAYFTIVGDDVLREVLINNQLDSATLQPKYFHRHTEWIDCVSKHINPFSIIISRAHIGQRSLLTTTKLTLILFCLSGEESSII